MVHLFSSLSSGLMALTARHLGGIVPISTFTLLKLIEHILITVSETASRVEGQKVAAEDSWFEARSACTQKIDTIYAESFLDQDDPGGIEENVRMTVSETLDWRAHAARAGKL